MMINDEDETFTRARLDGVHLIEKLGEEIA
jgi:hypothetical protein